MGFGTFVTQDTEQGTLHTWEDDSLNVSSSRPVADRFGHWMTDTFGEDHPKYVKQVSRLKAWPSDRLSDLA